MAQEMRDLREELAQLNKLIGAERNLKINLVNQVQEYKVSQVKKTLEKQEEIELAYTKMRLDKIEAYEKKISKTKDAEKKKALEKELADYKNLQGKQFETWKENLNKQVTQVAKYQEKLNEIEERSQKRIKATQATTNAFSSGKTITERLTSLKEGGLSGLSGYLGNYAASLNSQIESIARRRGVIDTALQGTDLSWNSLGRDITKLAAISPYVSQDSLANNIQTMIASGINFNVEQRAFLATITEKIAATFDANDASLRQLIKIQQTDTTASRLGMESALTAFLNNMFQTSEYMKQSASSVRSALLEATSLMGGTEATEFEYQAQKWLGSLSSVGFQDTSSLANALNSLASGDVNSLSSGTGTLLLMAANSIGMDISNILNKGLTATDTNNLLNAMTSYMANMYSQANGSKVLQQQYAKIFGLSASDLKAASNLASSQKLVYGNSLSNTQMIQRLSDMMSTMGKRMSIGEKLSNLKSNFSYTMAAGIANNPALYSLYNVSSLLDGLFGGGEFSLPLVVGTGTPQTFKTSDLLRIATLGGSAISGLPGMINSLGSLTNPSTMLRILGIGTGDNIVSRGTGDIGITVSGESSSSSGGYGINGNLSDIQASLMSEKTKEVNEQIANASQDQEEATLSSTNNYLNNIYTLLKQAINADGSFKAEKTSSDFAWSDTLHI